MKRSRLIIILMLLSQSVAVVAQELESMKPEDLFRIYRAESMADKAQMVQDLGFDDDKVIPTGNPKLNCKRYKLTMQSSAQGQWNEHITICNGSKQVVYSTENSTFYSQLKTKLISKYGFNEGHFVNGTELLQKNNSIIECKSSKPQGGDLTWHTIKIARLDAPDVDDMLPETPKVDIKKAQFRALVIGVQDYDNPIYNLQKSAEDARSLYTLLTKEYGFDAAESKLLTGRVSRAMILDALASMSNLRDDQNLLIFYAGHGAYTKGGTDDNAEGYWMPSDIVSGSQANAISNTEIKEHIRNINASHILLISDACFSGSLVNKERAIDVKSVLKSDAEYYRDKSRQVITSTTLSSTPDNSRFFQALLKVLIENRKRSISAEDVFVLTYNNLHTDNSDERSLPYYGRLKDVKDESGCFIFLKR